MRITYFDTVARLRRVRRDFGEVLVFAATRRGLVGKNGKRRRFLMGSLLDRFSRSKPPEAQAVEQTDKDRIDLIELYDDPSDIPSREDADLSDIPDEEKFSPYAEESDDADTDDAEAADNAARREETAAFARDAADFLKERGVSRELINWFFEAVGPGQFREALEVAERLYGLFGNDAEAAENYVRGLLPCQECGESRVPWFVAKRLLRSMGLERANPFTTREEARRGWRILHGAKAALMHKLVQPDVGYIVGPEDEDPEA